MIAITAKTLLILHTAIMQIIFHAPQAMSPYASAVLLLTVVLGTVQFIGMVFHNEVHEK